MSRAIRDIKGAGCRDLRASTLTDLAMRFDILALLPLAAQAVNIISSNDDGWAEVNIRAMFESLGGAGHSVVVSAPAENQSGTGM